MITGKPFDLPVASVFKIVKQYFNISKDFLGKSIPDDTTIAHPV